MALPSCDPKHDRECLAIHFSPLVLAKVMFGQASYLPFKNYSNDHLTKRDCRLRIPQLGLVVVQLVPVSIRVSQFLVCALSHTFTVLLLPQGLSQLPV